MREGELAASVRVLICSGEGRQDGQGRLGVGISDRTSADPGWPWTRGGAAGRWEFAHEALAQTQAQAQAANTGRRRTVGP